MSNDCQRCGRETSREYAVVSGNPDLLPDGYFCDSCTEEIQEFVASTPSDSALDEPIAMLTFILTCGLCGTEISERETSLSAGIRYAVPVRGCSECKRQTPCSVQVEISQVLTP